MRPVLSREQMRAFDRIAIQDCRVPSLLLMENAGRGAFERIRAVIPPRERVVVICGPGNNGGDGFVVARHLLAAAYPVEVALLATIDTLQGDVRSNAEAFIGIGGKVLELAAAGLPADTLEGRPILVDALFGTGLSRPLEGRYAAVVNTINASGCRVFALDLPSGLDADSGAVLGCAVRAERTVTFAHLKLGLLSDTARALAGIVDVVDIGVPKTLVDRVGASAELLEAADVGACLAKLTPPRHKGQAGKVLLLAGAPDTLGAARLATHGAFRAGAGMVKVATFPEAARALQGTNWEAMTSALDENQPEASLEALLPWADVVVAGPGLGTHEPARRLTRFLIQHSLIEHSLIEHSLIEHSLTEHSLTEHSSLPVVLDADGLNHFAHEPAALKACRHLLLTPHPGEAARLLADSIKGVEADRLAAARRLRQNTGATVLLKGPKTVIDSEAFASGLPRLNDTGNSALATAGSGDVLSGILGALCCRLPVHEAAFVGAWLHGLCAQATTRDNPRRRGTLAREIADQLPEVMASYLPS